MPVQIPYMLLKKTQWIKQVSTESIIYNERQLENRQAVEEKKSPAPNLPTTRNWVLLECQSSHNLEPWWKEPSVVALSVDALYPSIEGCRTEALDSMDSLEVDPSPTRQQIVESVPHELSSNQISWSIWKFTWKSEHSSSIKWSQ